MGKKPIVSVTYENERISGFFPHTNQISNVTQQCRCSPMLIIYFDPAWATFDLLGLYTSSILY